MMSSITTMQAINEKILSLDYIKFRAELKTVDAQESFSGGVIVLVTGYLSGEDSIKRSFTQTFFLAPQEKGYFVLNDMFRYMDDVEHHGGNQALVNGATPPQTPEQESVPVEDHRVSEQTVSLLEEEVNGDEVHNSSDNDDGFVVVEVDEIQHDSQTMYTTSSNVQDVSKKSYASIVKVMKESASPLLIPETNLMQAPLNVEGPFPAPALASEMSSSSSKVTESDGTQEAAADGHSIYIKNLPPDTTTAQLEEEFKKFGPIKSDGVQVRSAKQQEFCFGFVEFEVASAVQGAIEASPIMIGGRRAFVEEKRSSGSRVNNRGRFPAGRVGNGFRNDGARGRGNHGNPRSYSRGDSSNRTDYVNRGTAGGEASSRSGYRRVNHIENESGRMNRTGGLSVNAAAKAIATRVSVIA